MIIIGLIAISFFISSPIIFEKISDNNEKFNWYNENKEKVYTSDIAGNDLYAERISTYIVLITSIRDYDNSNKYKKILRKRSILFKYFF